LKRVRVRGKGLHMPYIGARQTRYNAFTSSRVLPIQTQRVDGNDSIVYTKTKADTYTDSKLIRDYPRHINPNVKRQIPVNPCKPVEGCKRRRKSPYSKAIKA
jgi:hypothetical protein